MVLKSRGLDIFGTTTSFYEMLTVRPLLDQMSVTLTFKSQFLAGIFLSVRANLLGALNHGGPCT
jgi:hypothetical protein